MQQAAAELEETEQLVISLNDAATTQLEDILSLRCVFDDLARLAIRGRA